MSNHKKKIHAPLLVRKNAKKVVISAQEYYSRLTVPICQEKDTHLYDAKIIPQFWQKKCEKKIVISAQEYFVACCA